MYPLDMHRPTSKRNKKLGCLNSICRRPLLVCCLLSLLTFIILGLNAVLIALIIMPTSTKVTTTTTTTIAQLPYNQTNSSNPTKTPYSCSGVSPYTLWTLYIDHGIMMNIDTSNCTFNSTPLYFTSIAGNAAHWDLMGYGAIYSATRSSFRIYARSFWSIWGINNTIVLSESVTQKWNVNWFGILE